MSIGWRHLNGCALGDGICNGHLIWSANGRDWRLRIPIFLFIVEVAIEVNLDFVNFAINAIRKHLIIIIFLNIFDL